MLCSIAGKVAQNQNETEVSLQEYTIPIKFNMTQVPESFVNQQKKTLLLIQRVIKKQKHKR